MEENRAPENGLAVQRTFAPNRLSEALLRRVYERLLEGSAPSQTVEEPHEALARTASLSLVLTGGLS